jgi:hypothetical protein
VAKKPPLTPLGKALRKRDAHLVSAWGSVDYGEAINAAIAGDVNRLVNLLRTHRRPTDDELDQLADFIEATAKHGHRQRDESVHKAAQLAETIMSIIHGRKPARVRDRAIEVACKQLERETGAAVDPERVRDLLNRPKRRRYSPP